MKVWGFTDPRSLKDKHLLGEHLEIHTCISGGWKNHPESLFNRFDGDIKWPIFRHELIRMAMNERWDGRHGDLHKSPIDLSLLGDLSVHLEAYKDFFELDRYDSQENFEAFMDYIEFPLSTLHYDTPWERERISMNAYWELDGVRVRQTPVIAPKRRL